jgi:6,7-dimethyl-8-ribityllumazine synthase
MARYDNINEIQPNLDGKGLRIGIAMSRFNMEVCEGLLSSAVAALEKAGVAERCGDRNRARARWNCR